MKNIVIQAIPNQSFSITLDNSHWRVSIKTENGIVGVSLTRDNVLVVENIRAVANEKIIPSEYEEAGNFVFSTLNFELPEYTKFGVTQLFRYISAVELTALRQPLPAKITSANFDPIASLPLRFLPVGYV